MTRGARSSAACLLMALVMGGCSDRSGPATGNDFAVLAESADGYAQARPGVALEFPRDHGPHPDFRIEWWYLTANLVDSTGADYGAQWTLFRTATRPAEAGRSGNPWQDPQVYMAHVAITTPDGHVALQRYARGGDHGGVARAGARAAPFSAWLDDWSLNSTGGAWLPLEVTAAEGGFGIDLRLDSDRPPVLQGQEGFSQKHPGGGGSHYYSQPFLNAAGRLRVAGQEVSVSGQAWLDREWSSQFLQPDQGGWDWFALHLDSGEKLMLFRLRGSGAAGDYRHGVLFGPAGQRTVLEPAAIDLRVIERVSVQGRALPLAWQVELPQINRSLTVRALHPGQWMDVDFAYWEGVVRVTGEGPGASGKGYLELTGYSAMTNRP